MTRNIVVTGSESGIGAALKRRLEADGHRVIGCDLRHAEVVADLATPEGRKALVEQVARISDGRVDAIVANAGGGPTQTLLSLNYFGAVATLEGLRPLLVGSSAPRAVAVSSIAAARPDHAGLAAACLNGDEAAANALAWRAFHEGRLGRTNKGEPDGGAAGAVLYGAAKRALQSWCAAAAIRPDWAGQGLILNVIALGVFDTPAARWILDDPDITLAMREATPLRAPFPGTAEEAAAAIVWLISPENSRMLGQTVVVDGGQAAWAQQAASHG